MFNERDCTLSIARDQLGNDSVILNEMIHCYETVINHQRLYFHDAVLWCLYKDLESRIEHLDTIIENNAHVLNSHDIDEIGGLHDLLFLLKSFDLDLKMNYPLGTVFGYGMKEKINDLMLKAMESILDAGMYQPI